MKNVAFIKGGDILKAKKIVPKKVKKEYEQLFTLGRKRGLNFVWTGIKNFKRSRFCGYAYFTGKEWKKAEACFAPDYIIDKSFFKYSRMKKKSRFAQAAAYLNPVQLQMIASDKMLTHMIFPDFTPEAYLVHTREEMKRFLKKIKTERVVVKSPYGFGGKAVRIVTKDSAKRMKLVEPTIVQEFIDSSKGIPGLIKGIHDLRLIFLGNKFVLGVIRTPPEGKLMSNLAQGGEAHFLQYSDIPDKVKQMARKITKTISIFPNTLYTIDFMYGNGRKPYLIEMNNNPGFDLVGETEEDVAAFFERLIEHIKLFI